MKNKVPNVSAIKIAWRSSIKDQKIPVYLIWLFIIKFIEATSNPEWLIKYIIKQRIQGIISVRVVREPDQCTGRQDVRKYSVDSINELIDQVNRAVPEYTAKGFN